MTADTIAAAPAMRLDRTARNAEFHRFYLNFYPRLARYCFRLVRDEELARDLTQEAFARLLARWLTIRDPEPYLFFVAANLVHTVRKRSRDESAALAVSDLNADRQVGGPDSGHHALYDAVDRLPRRYRVLVLLHYFADMPLADVAAVVHRPKGTVKRQLAEARALLAAALGTSDAPLVD